MAKPQHWARMSQLYSVDPYSETTFPESFLDPSEQGFTERLPQMVDESHAYKGTPADAVQWGLVLKVDDSKTPLNGKIRKINKLSSTGDSELGDEFSTCYIHTFFDQGKAVPVKLTDPKKELHKIYQHPQYEPSDAGAALLNLKPGDFVRCRHPVAGGWKNTVGTYEAVMVSGDPHNDDTQKKEDRDSRLAAEAVRLLNNGSSPAAKLSPTAASILGRSDNEDAQTTGGIELRRGVSLNTLEAEHKASVTDAEAHLKNLGVTFTITSTGRTGASQARAMLNNCHEKGICSKYFKEHYGHHAGELDRIYNKAGGTNASFADAKKALESYTSKYHKASDHPSGKNLGYISDHIIPPGKKSRAMDVSIGTNVETTEIKKQRFDALLKWADDNNAWIYVEGGTRPHYHIAFNKGSKGTVSFAPSMCRAISKNNSDWGWMPKAAAPFRPGSKDFCKK